MINIQNKNILYSSFLILFLFLCLFGLFYIEKITFKNSGIEDSILKGEDYYLESNFSNMRIDDIFFLMKIQESKTSYTELNSTIEYNLVNYNQSPFLRLIKPFAIRDDLNITIPIINSSHINTREDFSINEKYSNFFFAETDFILLKAMYCDVSKIDSDFFDYMNRRYIGDGDYLDTHIWISLLLLKELDCYDENLIEEFIQNITYDMIKIQDVDDEVGDLYAERIVLFYWSGNGHQVKKEWIDKIIARQNKDGGFPNIGSIESDYHTSGLSILSLIYYVGENDNLSVLLNE